MEKLIFATSNEGKLKEIRAILGDLGYEILSMKEAGIDVNIVEDGATFEENAIIKVKELSKIMIKHFIGLKRQLNKEMKERRRKLKK